MPELGVVPITTRLNSSNLFREAGPRLTVSIQYGGGSTPARGDQQSAPGTNKKTSRSSVQQFDWATLVDQIKAGDEAGMEQLYKVFRGGVRYYLGRQLGPQELEDRVRDTFLIIINAIKRCDLSEPDLLMGFVRSVVRQQVAAHIEKADESRRDEIDLEDGVTVADRAQNPEQQAIIRQKADLIQRSLSALSEKDLEILIRFYLHEQSQQQICREMDLTETQFGLTKSRANAKLGGIGRK